MEGGNVYTFVSGCGLGPPPPGHFLGFPAASKAASGACDAGSRSAFDAWAARAPARATPDRRPPHGRAVCGHHEPGAPPFITHFNQEGTFKGPSD